MTLQDRGEKLVPVLFLDFDGTVRKGYDELGRFVNGPQDVEVFPEVPAILRRYKQAGYRIVGITNQGGVALGHLSYEAMGAALMETHRQCGNLFDQISACIHHPDAADPEYARCWCRKPRIGLIIEACTAMHRMFNECYPPHLALFVGDRDEDRGCADAANIDFMEAATWRRGVTIHRLISASPQPRTERQV